MNISGIGGGGGSVQSAASFASSRQQIAEKAFKTADANGDGAVTKDEFVRTESGQAAPPRPITAVASDTLSTRTDNTSDKTVANEDATSGAAKLAERNRPAATANQAPSAQGPVEPTRADPAGGAASAKTAQGATSATNATSSADQGTAAPPPNQAADANSDGSVSFAEQLTYDLQQAVKTYRARAETPAVATGEFNTSA